LAEAGFVVIQSGKGRPKVPKVRIRELKIKINVLRWGDQLVDAH
jgi:hypothetical protein